MNQDIKLRFTIITVILIIFLVIGLFAVIYATKTLNSELQATIAAQDAEIKALEEENAELQVVVDEVNEAESAIRTVNPKATEEEAHTLAVRQVGKSRKYNIPRELITYRDWAEADLRWLDLSRKGPCGEHSTAQVWRPTFRCLRPTGDYNDMDQVYDAGTQYLADCYRTAKRWMPTAEQTELIRLTLAFYNAGMSHRPDEALYRARAHVRRVEGIFVKAERLGVV